MFCHTVDTQLRDIGIFGIQWSAGRRHNVKLQIIMKLLGVLLAESSDNQPKLLSQKSAPAKPSRHRNPPLCSVRPELLAMYKFCQSPSKCKKCKTQIRCPHHRIFCPQHLPGRPSRPVPMYHQISRIPRLQSCQLSPVLSGLVAS